MTAKKSTKTEKQVEKKPGALAEEELDKAQGGTFDPLPEGWIDSSPVTKGGSAPGAISRRK